ncbi:hypothetical protein PO124_02160 [Bacillus licheniformis]|nr:hypothetical protein [Bacillus licheniformis]
MGGWMESKHDWISCLIDIRDLNMVVEVGLVTGVTPAMTPTGSAISMTPSCSFH